MEDEGVLGVQHDEEVQKEYVLQHQVRVEERGVLGVHHSEVVQHEQFLQHQVKVEDEGVLGVHHGEEVQKEHVLQHQVHVQDYKYLNNKKCHSPAKLVLGDGGLAMYFLAMFSFLYNIPTPTSRVSCKNTSNKNTYC